MKYYEIICHRIGWWENLQESPIFNGKIYGFLVDFPLNQSIEYVPETIIFFSPPNGWSSSSDHEV